LFILVITVETAIRLPIKYAPLSPKKNLAFGKLNKINTKIIELIQNKIKLRLFISAIRLIEDNINKIIKE
tara:strand:- start:14 stop:223 length:210 start_codon:yes stop_codon:yes gene_type:complete